MAFHYSPPATYSEFFQRYFRQESANNKKRFNSLFSTDDSENLGEAGDLGFTSRPWLASHWLENVSRHKKTRIRLYCHVATFFILLGLLAMYVGGCPLN